MKQVIQNFKTGELYVDDVPQPSISEKMVLVENKFSLISAGTERGTVKVAKANLLGKAKQRPDLVAQVLQNVKKEGLKATLDKVRTKLNSLKALGYSTSGVVKASLDSNQRFKPGDRVACAGQDYASHAQFVAIPQNLVAKIPDNVSFEEASFTTLGAIALQGVRQATPRLGDKVLVIGLGLLGQLTVQLLKANGCNVFGIDLDKKLVDLAKKSGAEEAMLRTDSNLMTAIDGFTNGYGFDSVIITAATSSNDPIELSAKVSRKKGKVIVVGAVNMDVPRDPDFYRKELSLNMSCSYGPGRYDVNYEENGQDYPYAYVRYTEQRNMETFLQLISQSSIKLEHLITHIFDIEEAGKAYDIVLGKVEEPHIGILLSYPSDKDAESKNIKLSSVSVNQINVGFIGAGSFAQSYLIPNVKNHSKTSLDTVVTTKGITAKGVAEKFAFANASCDMDSVLLNKDINTIFIATPHNSHASYVCKALENNKNVFVEKPLALTYEDLEKVKSTMKSNPNRLLVGYNRRFAPASVAIKNKIESSNSPVVMNMRVNAGSLPSDHWVLNPEIGGGRVLGEVCHFIDLMQYFAGGKATKVFASCISTQNTDLHPQENLAVIVNFDDGSVGNLVYVANGDKALPKEMIEVFCGGNVGQIHDFRSAYWYSNNKKQNLKLRGKGHQQEVEAFLDSILKNSESPIAFDSLYDTTKITLKILDSISTGVQQDINE